MKPPVLESGTSVKMWGMAETGIIRLSGTVEGEEGMPWLTTMAPRSEQMVAQEKLWEDTVMTDSPKSPKSIS